MKNRNPTIAPLERQDSPLATLMEWKVEVELKEDHIMTMEQNRRMVICRVTELL